MMTGVQVLLMSRSSNEYFANLSCHQRDRSTNESFRERVVSPTSRFVNQLLRKWALSLNELEPLNVGILGTSHFTNGSFHQRFVSPTSHFTNEFFHQRVVSPTSRFVNQSFRKWVVLLTSYFAKDSFSLIIMLVPFKKTRNSSFFSLPLNISNNLVRIISKS